MPSQLKEKHSNQELKSIKICLNSGHEMHLKSQVVMTIKGLLLKLSDIVVLFILLSMAWLMRYIVTDEYKEFVKYFKTKIGTPVECSD